MALVSIEDYKKKLAETLGFLGNDFDPSEWKALGGEKETLLGLLRFKQQVSGSQTAVLPLDEPKKGCSWAANGLYFRNKTGAIISKNAMAALWNNKKVEKATLDASVEMDYLLDDKKAQQELFDWCVENGVLIAPVVKDSAKKAAE